MDNTYLVTAGLRPAGVVGTGRDMVLHPAIRYER